MYFLYSHIKKGICIIMYILNICILLCIFRNHSQRKTGNSRSPVVTVFLEEDGTEVEKDTFFEFNSGTIFLAGKNGETWSPSNGPSAGRKSGLSVSGFTSKLFLPCFRSFSCQLTGTSSFSNELVKCLDAILITEQY